MTRNGYFQAVSVFNINAVRYVTNTQAPTPEQTAAFTTLVNHQPDAEHLKEMLGLS